MFSAQRTLGVLGALITTAMHSLGARTRSSYKKHPLTAPAQLSSPSLNSSEHLLFKPHFKTDILSLSKIATYCRITLSSQRAVIMCTFLTWPTRTKTLPRFLMPLPLGYVGNMLVSSLPSAQHWLKKIGEAEISGRPFRGRPSPGSPSTGKATEMRRPKDTGAGQPGSRSSVRPGRDRLSTWRHGRSRV